VTGDFCNDFGVLGPNGRQYQANNYKHFTCDSPPYRFFQTKRFRVNGIIVSMKMWYIKSSDIWNQPEIFYQDIHACMIVYDCKSMISIEKIDEWKNELIKKLNRDIPLLFIANKKDFLDRINCSYPGLIDSYDSYAQMYLQSQNIQLIYTNCINGFNVEYAFQVIAEMVVNNNIKRKDLEMNHDNNEFIKQLENEWENGNYSDFIIEANNKQYKVNKLFLALRSPVMKAMLEQDMLEKKENKMIIKDIGEDVMLQLLRFLYGEKILKLDQVAERLLVVAEKYEMNQLKDICFDFLITDLNAENVLDYLKLAYLTNLEKLKKKSIDFIARNKKSIIDREEWNKLKRECPQLGFDFFEFNNL
jgi:speckle-type POZ protein